MTSELRFLTSNEAKLAEAQDILGPEILVRGVDLKIEELQTADTSELVRDKALRAYDSVRRPVFVEHTGLYLATLNGLPGGLTQVFWDGLRADSFSELYGNGETGARAVTTIGFVDGRLVHMFAGEIEGSIVHPPRGDRDFQWDCVFEPVGKAETFAEMGKERKNAISMRRVALEKLRKHVVSR